MSDASSTSKLRVLVVAEQCNPDWVSVPLVAWSHYRAIADHPDVERTHLVTQQRNREAITNFGLVEGRDVTYIDHEYVVGPLYKLANLLGGRGGKGWTIRVAAYSLAYPHFERLLWKQFAPQLKAGEFDVVHQLSPLSPTTSPTLGTRCRKIDKPFIWGPINGGVPWPRAFMAEQRKEREWLTKVRGVSKLMPRYKAVRKDAAALLVGSGHTLRQMPDYARDRCLYLPENAVDPSKFNVRRTRSATDGSPLRLVYLSRLVPYKGADMALAAAEPLLKSGRATFDIYGKGPLETELANKAGDLPGVTLHGWADHKNVPGVLADHDVQVFPSIREFGGGVVLEAMAVGLPSLIVNYAGPAELVDDDVGWSVPIGNRASIVASVRERLEQIDADRAAIDSKGAACVERASRLHTWPHKACCSVDTYRWVLGDGPKPSWGEIAPHLEV